MQSIILDGKALSDKIKQTLKEEISIIQKKINKIPNLATILVGNNPSSHTYVNMKAKACLNIGMGSEKIELPENTTTEELLATIDKLNEDPNVHGILLQHPSPKQDLNPTKYGIIHSEFKTRDMSGK
jgi:methylenetetrahydrofolate dehydrogenase (NADP+)/methenyltetrahydrofolate cyclohydrolase